MKIFKTLKNIILIILVFTVYNIAQQQQHIPWPSLADSPWPFLRGDMQATGRSKYIGPSTNNMIWRKDMPFGVIFGPVLGYNDILYMGTSEFSPIGENYFYAVNHSGENLWTYSTELGYANNIAPIISKDSTLIFGSASKSIYALKPNGKIKYKLDNIIWGTPHCFMTLTKNGDLYVPSADTLVIIDSNGTVKEKRTIEGLKGRSFVFSTGGDTVYYFTGGGDISNVGSLKAANLNGDEFWSYDFATHNLGTPLIDNSNNIYVFGTDSVFFENFFLYCIKGDGSMKWKYRIDYYEYYSSPTIDNNGNIVFHAVENTPPQGENLIVSLDYNGNENWKTTLPGDFFSNIINHGLVCDAEGKIYFGPTFGGNFYCLNSDGIILWTYNLGELEYDSSPAIGSDGTLYIGTHNGFSIENLIAIRDTVTFVEDESKDITDYQLVQNFPNPFNSTSNIRYSIPQAGRVILKVYDIVGRVVAVLLDRYQETGSYDVIFQPKDLASGIYFYTLTSGNFTATKKLIMLK